jgi:hypothetical protein
MEEAYQGSNSFLDVQFKDDLGKLVVPTSGVYNIVDAESGTVILEDTKFTPIISTYTIEIEPEQNILLDTNNDEEEHIVNVSFTYSGGKIGIGVYKYKVLKVEKVPEEP